MNNSGNQGYRGNRFRRPETPDNHRINHRISAREVRLISDSGEQLGVVPIKEALMMAETADLDLVEVAAEAKPPVCKLMDYGKFKYREQKKEAALRKNTGPTIKEIRLRYSTDKHDLETKVKNARRFIARSTNL